MNKIFAYAGIAIYLLFFMSFGLVVAVADQSTINSSENRIVQLDISYKLFMALAAYQELVEAEKAGDNINQKILPVLTDIITHIRNEKSKIEALCSPENTTAQIKKVLKRMDENINSFSAELLYRQQLVKLELLMEKQRKMIDENR